METQFQQQVKSNFEMAVTVVQDVSLSFLITAMLALLLSLVYLIWGVIALSKKEDSILKQQLWQAIVVLGFATFLFILLFVFLMKGGLLKGRLVAVFIVSVILLAVEIGMVSWALNQYYISGTQIVEATWIAVAVAIVTIVILGISIKFLLSPPSANKATKETKQPKTKAVEKVEKPEVEDEVVPDE